MKDYVRIISIMLCSLTCLCGYAQHKENNDEGGVLWLANSTVDVGAVSGDSIVSGTLTLYNKGAVPVEIIKIFTDCSCSATSYSDQPIAPGDSLNVTLKFNPRGYKYNRFRNRFRIRSTATNPYLSAFLTGSIKK